jgi:predicted secreted hydrolase
MGVDGSISIDGVESKVDGTAWMDREYGEVGPDEAIRGWVWMSIQLSDGREMMVYRLNRRGSEETYLRAACIDRGGSVKVVAEHEIRMYPTKTWISQATGAEYPVSWVLQVPCEAIELVIEAKFDAVEFDTRGTTSTIYWEGPAQVRGVKHGERIAGDAFVEIVGHVKKRLPGQFDHARRNLPLLGYFANEIRIRLFGASCYRIQHGDSF